MAPYNITFRTTAEVTPGTPQSGILSLPFDSMWLWVGGAAGGVGIAGAVIWKKGIYRNILEGLRSIPTRFRSRLSGFRDRLRRFRKRDD